MKARTRIPELEAMIEENRKRRWIPEVNGAIMDYYVQFAADSDLKSLAAYINGRFDTKFTTQDITSHYHKIKERR